MVPLKCGTVQLSGSQLEPGNGDAGPTKEVPTHFDISPHIEQI